MAPFDAPVTIMVEYNDSDAIAISAETVTVWRKAGKITDEELMFLTIAQMDVNLDDDHGGELFAWILSDDQDYLAWTAPVETFVAHYNDAMGATIDTGMAAVQRIKAAGWTRCDFAVYQQLAEAPHADVYSFMNFN